jgi:hypothetical protein
MAYASSAANPSSGVTSDTVWLPFRIEQAPMGVGCASASVSVSASMTAIASAGGWQRGGNQGLQGSSPDSAEWDVANAAASLSMEP